MVDMTEPSLQDHENRIRALGGRMDHMQELIAKNFEESAVKIRAMGNQISQINRRLQISCEEITQRVTAAMEAICRSEKEKTATMEFGTATTYITSVQNSQPVLNPCLKSGNVIQNPHCVPTQLPSIATVPDPIPGTQVTPVASPITIRPPPYTYPMHEWYPCSDTLGTIGSIIPMASLNHTMTSTNSSYNQTSHQSYYGHHNNFSSPTHSLPVYSTSYRQTHFSAQIHSTMLHNTQNFPIYCDSSGQPQYNTPLPITAPTHHFSNFATGLEDSLRLKYKDGNLYVPNQQAETSEIWMNPRDLPSLQSGSCYMTGQTAHAAAYLPSRTGHASFNSDFDTLHRVFPQAICNSVIRNDVTLLENDGLVNSLKNESKIIAMDITPSLLPTQSANAKEQTEAEVLFLVDPIDEDAVTNLKSYNEKNFADISKEDLDLGDKNEEKEKEIKQEFGQTCDWIKKRVGDKVTRVQISSRLSTSPCVLVSGKFGWSANMERLMKAQAVGDTASLEFMRGRRVFEINPEHPIIRTLDTAYRNSPNDEEALRAIDLLYDTTLVFSGFTPDSPAQLGWKIYEMVGMALTVLPAIMYKLSKRFVSVILRNGGARFHDAAAHVSTFNTFNDSTGEIDTKPRWYLVLTVGKCSGSVSTTHRNLRHEQCLGNRYESTAAASESSDSPAMKYEYQAEVNRLINLKVNSLYSKKEVFLRELISNASDALDKLRFLRVTDSELIKGAVDLDIRIHTDKDKGIVTTTDSGFGMTHQELVDCLGTITQSGTTKFLKALKYSKAAGADSTLIGQFVVGFYSSFLVCDRVIVSTKSPKSDKQYEWEGEVNSSFYSIREETLKELVMLPLQRLELFCKGQLTKPCKGILSFGPPGTGQTMIAKAVATETGANFIIISMSSITSKWLGEGEKYVKAVFTLASKVAPSVVVVDEVDSMLGQRENPGEHGAMLKMKNEYDFGYCTTPLVFDPGGVLEFLQIFANHG